ncbi:Long-chain-fatty-acid--CoA ligase 1 [Nosema granulosis]|uniref:Long-chain-fatty-acid--CoA ligase 1 n=1 Tax=Nosema granulosis TaxID=83296 RepID=A0A9P6GZQ8_9MICR|nr:Long-chain-fatty-acid--CoA ligase 1 [Nosema granulosis]
MESKRVIKTKDNEYHHINYLEDVNCTTDGSETLLQLFLNSCNVYKTNNYLGTIKNDKLSWQTYEEIEKQVTKLSSFLNKLTKPKETIGIFSVNRYEWLVCEYASYMSGCSNCPLYSTFGPEAISLVLAETEMSICGASAEKALSLYNILKEQKVETFLKHLIVFDYDETLVEKFSELGVAVYFFNAIIENEEINLRPSDLKGDDIATLCYTSGTSGKPKGVILTHRNFICNISAFFRGSNNEMIEISSKEVYLSYLPLAHVMERVCVSVLLSTGGSIGFFRGNPKIIQKDYLIIKPTFIAAVPRVLNLFKEKIEEQLSKRSWFTRFIFNLALKLKIWRQSSGVFENWLLDTLIFNRIRREFGGRIRGILCGSAPLNPNVLTFLEAVLCAQIFQGYGQTETTGATTLKPIDFYEFNNVGIPFPSNKIKLVPVQGYDHDCGEMYVKGCNITKGYFKRPEDTAELFDNDGWLKTGDIVRVEDGVFNIVGRRKEIFKTSFGEYIVPEKIENLFIGGIIQDIFITGGTYSDKLTAIVVCPDTSVDKAHLLEYIEKKGKGFVENKKINKYEIPSYIILLHKGFDTYTGKEFLTPTAKKRRNNIEKYFKEEIVKAQQD